jgi:hypothetical protein
LRGFGANSLTTDRASLEVDEGGFRSCATDIYTESNAAGLFCIWVQCELLGSPLVIRKNDALRCISEELSNRLNPFRIRYRRFPK